MSNTWICQNLTLGLLKTVSKETYLFAKERMRIIETAIIFYVKKNLKRCCVLYTCTSIQYRLIIKISRILMKFICILHIFS